MPLVDVLTASFDPDAPTGPPFMALQGRLYSEMVTLAKGAFSKNQQICAPHFCGDRNAGTCPDQFTVGNE
jgi:hypothetical protein